MKRVFFYFLAGVTVLFAACSSEEGGTIEREAFSTVPSLNLQSLDYDDLARVLSNVSPSEKAVILEDGSNAWTVYLKQNQIDIEERGHKINVFTGRKKDSIETILSPDYATLRLHKNGELISYVAYKNSEKMADVANHYSTRFLVNRSAVINDIVTLQRNSDTRSTERGDIKCVRINVTKAIENNPVETFYPLPQGKRANSQISPLSNRSSGDIQRTISFVLLKEKNGNSQDHEIAWQIADADSSIEPFVSSGIITPGFIIMDTEYEGNNDFSEAALLYFQAHLRKADAAMGHGEKTFILMRDGTWGNELGIVTEIGTIHLINPYSDFEIAALSTSSSLYPRTLAHEIGHLLGAIHVDDSNNFMHSKHSENQTINHSADNIDRILTSLHLGM